MSTEFELGPGVEVAGRFRIEGTLPSAGSRPAFRALDSSSGQHVVLFRLTEAETRGLSPIVGLDHAHLARVVALPKLEDGTTALVCEDVGGPRLDLVLDEMGHETPVEAVRSALRVADALSALHRAGAVHGFLHPGSVIVAPDGRKPPLLTFAPPPEAPSAFRSPSFAQEPVPSVADDTWGVTALFHYMLVGNAPPSAGFEHEAPLEEAGVKDPVLRAALLHGLHADEKRRSQDLIPLRRELARWYVDRAGDESSGPFKLSNPPPLPQASGGAEARSASRSPSTPRRRSRGLVLGIAAGVFLLALGVAWALSSLRPTQVQVVEVTSAPPASSPPAPAVSGPSIDLGEVAVTSDAGASDETAQCVSEFLPSGTFGPKLPDFSWLCAEPDPREGALRLRSALVAGRPPGSLTDVMRIIGQLSWYELPTYGVVYRACCAEAPPLKLPDPAPGCPRIDGVLEQIASDALSERPVDATLKQLSAAIDCEASANRAAIYRQTARPRGSEEPAFREFLKALR